MASTVQTNSSIAAGGRAVMNRDYSLGPNGQYRVQVTFACLPAYLSTHLSSLSVGQTAAEVTTPTGTAKVSAIPSWKTEAGLSYITVEFTAIDASNAKYLTKTISKAPRSFSATGLLGAVSQSFDYLATTVSVSGNAPLNPADYESLCAPGTPYNNVGGPLSPGTMYEWVTSETISPQGITFYTGSLTGIYYYDA